MTWIKYDRPHRCNPPTKGPDHKRPPVGSIWRCDECKLCWTLKSTYNYADWCYNWKPSTEEELREVLERLSV